MKTTDNQKELFIVVDENDSVLGYRTREECHLNKHLIHRSISIVISNNKREILIQKRSKTKDMYPGYFTVSASGHVGKGETYRKAAKREMYEEIGIKSPLKFIGKYLLKMPHETEYYALFTSKHNGPYLLNKNEIEKIMFLKPSEIKSIKNKLTPTAYDCFKRLEIL